MKKHHYVLYASVLAALFYLGAQYSVAMQMRQTAFADIYAELQERLSGFGQVLGMIRYAASAGQNPAPALVPHSHAGTCYLEADMERAELDFSLLSAGHHCQNITALQPARKVLHVAPLMTYLAHNLDEVLQVYFTDIDHRYYLFSPRRVLAEAGLSFEQLTAQLQGREYAARVDWPLEWDLAADMLISGPYRDVFSDQQVVTLTAAVMQQQRLGLLHVDLNIANVLDDHDPLLDIEVVNLADHVPAEGDYMRARLGEQLQLQVADDLTARLVFFTQHRHFEILQTLVLLVLVFVLVYGRLLYGYNRLLLHTSTVDPLTGVLNRRGMNTLLGQPSWQQQVAMLEFDLDHFKQVNDRWGHAAGDAVICSFAECMQHSVRNGDCVVRLGGEEFLVILPGASAASAYAIAERIRTRMERQVVHYGAADIRVTASGGIALASGLQTSEELAAVLARADTQLYRAKHSGRNCVIVE